MTFENFREDDKTVDAVIRNFEIIGEAANNLSDDFKGDGWRMFATCAFKYN